MSDLKKVVLALGSNMGDCKLNLEKAITSIANIAEVISVSEVYETEPVGYLEQANFFNAVILCQTVLLPDQLLNVCKKIESKMGRVASFRNAPRPIDIDIIFYEGVSMESENLQIPHPRWSERDFVISPLFDIFDNSLFEVNFKCDVCKVLTASQKKYKSVFSLKK